MVVVVVAAVVVVVGVVVVVVAAAAAVRGAVAAAVAVSLAVAVTGAGAAAAAGFCEELFCLAAKSCFVLSCHSSGLTICYLKSPSFNWPQKAGCPMVQRGDKL